MEETVPLLSNLQDDDHLTGAFTDKYRAVYMLVANDNENGNNGPMSVIQIRDGPNATTSHPATAAEWDIETRRCLFRRTHETGAFGVLRTATELRIIAVHDGNVMRVPPLCIDTKRGGCTFNNGHALVHYKSIADFFWHYRRIFTTLIVCATEAETPTRANKAPLCALRKQTRNLWEIISDIQRKAPSESTTMS